MIKPRRSPSRRPSSPKAMAATKTLSRAPGIVRVRFEAAWRALRHTPPFFWCLQLLRSTKRALSHSCPNLAAVTRLAQAFRRPQLPIHDLGALPAVSWGLIWDVFTTTVDGRSVSGTRQFKRMQLHQTYIHLHSCKAMAGSQHSGPGFQLRSQAN